MTRRVGSAMTPQAVKRERYMREGLMMDDYPLTLTSIVERVERFSADREACLAAHFGLVVQL